MKIFIIFFMIVPTTLSFASCNSGDKPAGNSDSTVIKINPSQMKQIGRVDERYQSYNVEMVEVVGGKFWKPYKMMDSLPSGKATSTYDISQNNDQMYRQQVLVSSPSQMQGIQMQMKKKNELTVL